MQEDNNAQDNGSRVVHEGSGHSSEPRVQTPDKPSQAEGDPETIDESIKEKEAQK